MRTCLSRFGAVALAVSISLSVHAQTAQPSPVIDQGAIDAINAMKDQLVALTSIVYVSLACSLVGLLFAAFNAVKRNAS